MRVCWKKPDASLWYWRKFRQHWQPVWLQELTIPVIGIGAGGGVDGQVLVVTDMLGMTKGFSPRFLRRYADLNTVMTDAIGHYVADVKACDFPNESEQY